MTAKSAARRGTLLRDLLIFQFKLVLDGLKDIALIQLSIGAALFDLLFHRPGRPMLFYSVLRLSERFDLWMNLYGASARAELDDDGLFGASRAGSNTMLGQLERLVRNRVDPREEPQVRTAM